jgi:CubicO group peptidase (beta-lactamase class C family)
MIIKKPLLLFVFLVASCGGSGNSGQSRVSPTIPSTTPTHPIVWDIATPESVGMSKVILDEAFRYAMEDGSYTQAAVVIKDGKLVYERYRGITRNEASILNESISIDFVTLSNLYNERDVRSYVSSWSTAKSFTSIALALAVEEGFINSINDSAASYITEWSTDERSAISIKNLLDMKSGFSSYVFYFFNK